MYWQRCGSDAARAILSREHLPGRSNSSPGWLADRIFECEEVRRRDISVRLSERPARSARLHELPMTPERVLAALKRKA